MFFKLPRHFRETFLPRCFHTLPRVQPRARTHPVMTRRILPKTNDKENGSQVDCVSLSFNTLSPLFDPEEGFCQCHHMLQHVQPQTSDSKMSLVLFARTYEDN